MPTSLLYHESHLADIEPILRVDKILLSPYCNSHIMVFWAEKPVRVISIFLQLLSFGEKKRGYFL